MTESWGQLDCDVKLQLTKCKNCKTLQGFGLVKASHNIHYE